MTDQEFASIKKKFGKNLKAIREKKGLSVLALSYNCAIDNSKIAKIEQGQFNITLRTITELAKGLDTPVSKLFDYD